MRAAVAARAGSQLQILGVTVLTSFGPEDMDDLGYDGTVASLVERRARKAVELGVDGIVASPLEAAAVRRIVGPDTVIVTPGVRSAGVDAGDQKRVATPAQAILRRRRLSGDRPPDHARRGPRRGGRSHPDGAGSEGVKELAGRTKRLPHIWRPQ